MHLSTLKRKHGYRVICGIRAGPRGPSLLQRLMGEGSVVGHVDGRTGKRQHAADKATTAAQEQGLRLPWVRLSVVFFPMAVLAFCTRGFDELRLCVLCLF